MPVSIISGDSTKETIDRAFTYQIVDMLEKPFNDQSIKMVIEKTLFFKEMNNK
jgi:FixJ family two-component response regulator